LPASEEIVIEILEPKKRPVSAVADYTEIRDVKRVSIKQDNSITLTLLFDPEHNLEDRILNEQFNN
jgi:NAD+ kinase